MQRLVAVRVTRCYRNLSGADLQLAELPLGDLVAREREDLRINKMVELDRQIATITAASIARGLQSLSGRRSGLPRPRCSPGSDVSSSQY